MLTPMRSWNVQKNVEIDVVRKLSKLASMGSLATGDVDLATRFFYY